MKAVISSNVTVSKQRKKENGNSASKCGTDCAGVIRSSEGIKIIDNNEYVCISDGTHDKTYYRRYADDLSITGVEDSDKSNDCNNNQSPLRNWSNDNDGTSPTIKTKTITTTGPLNG